MAEFDGLCIVFDWPPAALTITAGLPTKKAPAEARAAGAEMAVAHTLRE
jgi:hypothetical protein